MEIGIEIDIQYRSGGSHEQPDDGWFGDEAEGWFSETWDGWFAD